MLRRTILGTLAAGTVTGTAMFVHQVARQFAVADWLQNGQPSAPAAVGMFAVILIGVAGADLVRYLVKVATRS
jgi:hypothetical protein